MEKRRLGTSGIVVSEICMGTMTFGTQAGKDESFRIMDEAVESGIDFFDTAEVYPVPPTEELAGLTEKWVGEWRAWLVVPADQAREGGAGPGAFTQGLGGELEKIGDGLCRSLSGALA
jgi:aryl-alcohol dehydrogenase-like predicted oxidoreductase